MTRCVVFQSMQSRSRVHCDCKESWGNHFNPFGTWRSPMSLQKRRTMECNITYGPPNLPDTP
eukprot:3446026-Amphidinium_carterae.2